MVRSGFAALALMAAVSAHAQPADDTCRNSAGQRLNTPKCVEYFKASRPLTDAQCFADSACRAAAEARGDAERAKRDAEHQADLAKVDQAEKALTERCGNDRNSPRLGMPLRRVLDCVEGLSLVQEERTKAGLVQIYGDGASYVRISRGVVVALGRH